MRTGLVERLRYIVLVRRPAPPPTAQLQVLDVLSRLVRHSPAVVRSLWRERSFGELVGGLVESSLPSELPLLFGALFG